jgi:hypothetical protein
MWLAVVAGCAIPGPGVVGRDSDIRVRYRIFRKEGPIFRGAVGLQLLLSKLFMY